MSYFKSLCTLALAASATQTALGQVCANDGSSSSVSVSFVGENTVIKASGCPQYDWTGQTTPNTAKDQDYTFIVPTNPVLCKNPTSYVGVFTDLDQSNLNPQPVMGPIGLSTNGVALFGNADADKEDAYVNEARTFNECNGHATADSIYHYHSEVPDECQLFKQVEGEHSPLFGLLADGIPIYGPLGDNGQVPDDLDECNGHVDATHNFYHYHVTANIKYPYLINCLKGKVDQTNFKQFRTLQTCEPAAEQYDYSSVSFTGSNDGSNDSTGSGSESLSLNASVVLLVTGFVTYCLTRS